MGVWHWLSHRIERASTAAFTCALLVPAAIAAHMLASGIERHAQLASDRARVAILEAASAPLPAGQSLRGWAGIEGAPGISGLTLIVRVDAPPAARSLDLCALASALKADEANDYSGATPIFIAFSPRVPSCLSDAVDVILRGAPDPAGRAHDDMRDARIVLLDAELRVVYSRRDYPAISHLRRVVALFHRGVPDREVAAAEVTHSG